MHRSTHLNSRGCNQRNVVCLDDLGLMRFCADEHDNTECEDQCKSRAYDAYFYVCLSQHENESCKNLKKRNNVGQAYVHVIAALLSGAGLNIIELTP